jgi:hypothetical protein
MGHASYGVAISPSNPRPIVLGQQFAICVTTKNKIQVEVSTGTSGSDAFSYSLDTLTLTEPYTLPAGSSMEVALRHDDNSRIMSATLGITLRDGQSVTQPVDLLAANQVKKPETTADLAAVVAFTFNIIGFLSNMDGNFQGGSGVISYATSNDLTIENTVPDHVADNYGVNPSSNVDYGSMENTQGNSFGQSFQVTS